MYKLKIKKMKNNIAIETNINPDPDPDSNISPHHHKKLTFLFNALEKGWTVKKMGDSYIFTKKHEGKREIFRENYLETFIYSNFEEI